MNERINSLLKSTYRDKGTDFSASQLTKPSYQLWVEKNAPKVDRVGMVGFKSYLGSAMHLSFEVQDLMSVTQEFSHIKNFEGVSIGGTCDRLDWMADKEKWELGDYKLKGDYSYRKFIDGEREKEILQLSIYRWIYKGLFDIADEATIYLFMSGHTSRSKHPEYQEVTIPLYSIEHTEQFIRGKIKDALSEEPPAFDCETSWACNYCDVCDSCPYLKEKNKSAFSNES